MFCVCVVIVNSFDNSEICFAVRSGGRGAGCVHKRGFVFGRAFFPRLGGTRKETAQVLFSMQNFSSFTSCSSFPTAVLKMLRLSAQDYIALGYVLIWLIHEQLSFELLAMFIPTIAVVARDRVFVAAMPTRDRRGPRFGLNQSTKHSTVSPFCSLGAIGARRSKPLPARLFGVVPFDLRG